MIVWAVIKFTRPLIRPGYVPNNELQVRNISREITQPMRRLYQKDKKWCSSVKIVKSNPSYLISGNIQDGLYFNFSISCSLVAPDNYEQFERKYEVGL